MRAGQAGKNPKDAFARACEEARYERGHGGYTGTIAEKSEFTMITVPLADGLPDVAAARAYASDLLDKGDRRVDDKWGPAGCIEVAAGLAPADASQRGRVANPGERRFLFFGWASS